jgi:hypothetical protein
MSGQAGLGHADARCRVGSTVSALAIDLDTRLLEELANDRVEVRRTT